MNYRTLMTADEVARHLGDPGYVVVDCRFNLNDTGWGEMAYLAGHIPGALYAHLDRDLSGIKTGVNGRHPLPDIDALAATFGRWGIDDTVQVVTYDQDTGMYASRLWWLLRWLGHDAVAVLDGGWTAWRSAARPVANGRESPTERHFTARPRAGHIVDADEVAQLLGRPDWKLVDARAPERFRGDVEPIDNAAGHIPGAVNHFFQWNLGSSGEFLSRETLRTKLETVLGGTPPDRVVSYCGSGVTACHNLLALEHAGLPGGRLYPGSWSEWASDRSRPIASAKQQK